jgi:hypothetical protein
VAQIIKRLGVFWLLEDDFLENGKSFLVNRVLAHLKAFFQLEVGHVKHSLQVSQLRGLAK